MTSVKVNTTEKQKLTFREIREAALNPSNGLSLYQIMQLITTYDEKEFAEKLKQFIQENSVNG